MRTWEGLGLIGGYCGGERKLGMTDLEDSFQIALRLFPPFERLGLILHVQCFP